MVNDSYFRFDYDNKIKHIVDIQMLSRIIEYTY